MYRPAVNASQAATMTHPRRMTRLAIDWNMGESHPLGRRPAIPSSASARLRRARHPSATPPSGRTDPVRHALTLNLET